MKFREISTALFINKFFLNAIIISIAFLSPVLETLLLAVIFSELLEIAFLFVYFKNKKVKLIPQFNMKIFKIDKKSWHYILFSGGNKLINSFAIQFPIIFLVIVMGEKLAPEFQLPLYAVSVPASMIMVSFSKVLFPHFSNIRDSNRIRDILISIEFVITLIILPVLICISFFSKRNCIYII